jgi:hypothetical protein
MKAAVTMRSERTSDAHLRYLVTVSATAPHHNATIRLRCVRLCAIGGPILSGGPAMAKSKSLAVAASVALALAGAPLNPASAHGYHHGGPVLGLVALGAAVVVGVAAIVTAPIRALAAPVYGPAPGYYPPPPAYSPPPPPTYYYAPPPYAYYPPPPPGYYGR